MMDQTSNPFRITWHDQIHAAPLRFIARRFEWAIERLLGLDRLARVYQSLREEESIETKQSFAARVLKRFGVQWQVDEDELERIPKSGPVVVVANHPFGGIEGLVLFDLLAQIRPDARILANFLVERIPELRPMVIAADPFVRIQARARNVIASRAAIDWLAKGGLVAMFPAGVVSHLQLNPLQVRDPIWSETAVRFAISSQAKVVPIYFQGRNSWLFQLAGVIYPRLRTALLPREFGAKQGKLVHVRIGNAISEERLCQFENRTRATDYLRARTYLLDARPMSPTEIPECTEQHETAIAPGPDKHLLELEIANLNAQHRLLTKGSVDFYCAPAEQIPLILAEIGRQREISFRAAGEGTGKAVDLDQFDQRYLHLFAWNRQRAEIAGAYRLAPAAELVDKFGTEGLYTHSLFKFGPELISRLGNSLEMGRSFVSVEYQRSSEVLLGLWQGIAEFVWKNPHLHSLFGLVSISRLYNNTSRQVIVDFMGRKLFRADLAALARPVFPFRSKSLHGLLPSQLDSLETAEDVDAVLADIERKKIPVLLKHYLKLGAEAVNFGVDPNFSDTVVVLIVVDLLRTDPKRIERFMGKDRADLYLEQHGVKFQGQMLAPLDSTESLVEQSDRQSIL